MVASGGSCKHQNRLRVSLTLRRISRSVCSEARTSDEQNFHRIATYANPFTRFDLVSNCTSSKTTFAANTVSDHFLVSTFVSSSVWFHFDPFASDLRLSRCVASPPRACFFPCACTRLKPSLLSRHGASCLQTLLSCFGSLSNHVPIGSSPLARSASLPPRFFPQHPLHVPSPTRLRSTAVEAHLRQHRTRQARASARLSSSDPTAARKLEG